MDLTDFLVVIKSICFQVNNPRFSKYRFFKQCVFAVAILLFGCQQGTLMATPKVAVSTLPLHSLVSIVMDGVGEPDLMMPSGQSPHHQSLLPSTVRKVTKSDLIVWVGPTHEASLTRAIRGAKQEAVVITLINEPQLIRLPVRTGDLWDMDHNHHSEDDSDGHSDKEFGDEESGHQFQADQDSGRMDGHVWLSTDNAKTIIRIVAERLRGLDRENAGVYAKNMASAYVRIDNLQLELKDQLATFDDHSYLVFHDAYQYFEAEFGLYSAGVVSMSPERSPSARSLMGLRELVEQINSERQLVCIFREPQFKSSAIDILAEGNTISAFELDPVGIGIDPGKELWFTLMKNLGNSFELCMGTQNPEAEK